MDGHKLENRTNGEWEWRGIRNPLEVTEETRKKLVEVFGNRKTKGKGGI